MSGVFCKDDLQKLMNRRTEKKPLDTIEIDDKITDRYYQKNAIRAVCAHIAQGFRRNLLVMATGTGKTRTASSLTDVLSRGGHVTNVLFLADRTALVKQAKDDFKKYLPDQSLCNLCSSKDDKAARIVFSTYPTMLNAIDNAKTKDGVPLFSPAHFDLIIVDEFSMVDMWLAQQFFKRISQHTRVVLVGDPNQLPSVGAGNVFYELIHSGMVPVTVLDWIFRQSKDGLIAYNAKFINEGSTKLYYGNDFVFVDSPTQIESAKRIQDIYCKEAAERGIENVQILSPFREKGEAASEQLNRAIRERVNPFRSAEEEVKIGNRTFRVHDRIMQTKNTEKVSNGDLGFITGITTSSKGERLVQMDFGGDRKLTYTPEQLAHVDLAYATTIHKAMGSEFETVIIPIVKAHTIMLYRNLLYTAVTRAKKKVILVGHKPILFMAVHRADISKRNTMLGERIRLYCKAYHTERNVLPELQQAG